MHPSWKKTLLYVLIIPTLYAVLLRLFFGVKTWAALFSVMSVSFLFCLPTIMGIITMYVSRKSDVQKYSYRIFAPWIPIFAFFVLTLLASLEGWACWIMILPLFMVAASIGGLIGGYLRSRKRERQTYLFAGLFMPFLVAPLETLIGTIPGTYEAYTFIDINAPAETIWRNITRVHTIKKEEDRGWLTHLLDMPRPVEAVLDYEAVGASREARFTRGLVFRETVTDYVDKKKMTFSITANPYAIPSTTMDEHIVIGGRYFDVLTGTYELESLPNRQWRVHLYSRFKLSTSFNFYASWWAKWIMKDIQYTILQVEKDRAERAQ